VFRAGNENKIAVHGSRLLPHRRMSNVTSYFCRMQFLVGGISVPSFEIRWPGEDAHGKFTQETHEGPIVAVIEVGGGAPRRDVALRMVREVYTFLLRAYAGNIDRAEAPTVVDESPPPPTGGGPQLAQEFRATLRLTGKLSRVFILGEGRVTALVQEVQVRLDAPAPAFAAQLYIALGLFASALQAEDPAVRFLILYDCIHLFAEFKLGGQQGQLDIDSLITAAEPRVHVAATGRLFTSGKKKGTRAMETRYTKLRNDFVHAHERGADPETARNEMGAKLGDFQATAARILR
jgi:hypothetical protein